MKSAVYAAASLMVTAVIAQPHHHQHKERHNKRDPIVWTTEVVSTTEIVGLTTTVWVSAGGAPADAVKTGSPPAVSAVSEAPAQFFQTSAKSAVAAAPVPTTLATTSSPPAAVIPTSPSVVAAPPVSSSSSAAPVVAPTTSVAPVVIPTTSAAVAAAPSQSAASGGSSSGGGSSGTFSGDLTFYDFSIGQKGSCGTEVDGTKTAVIALPIAMMTAKLKAAGLTDPNKNPLCGAAVTIYYNGKSTPAVVADSCGDCVGEAIDLSHKTFQNLGIDEGLGRVKGTWSYS